MAQLLSGAWSGTAASKARGGERRGGNEGTPGWRGGERGRREQLFHGLLPPHDMTGTRELRLQLWFGEGGNRMLEGEAERSNDLTKQQRDRELSALSGEIWINC